MTEEDFAESVKHAIPRYAAQLVRRGTSTDERSLEVSKQDFAQLLPQGFRTPGHYFYNVVDEAAGSRGGRDLAHRSGSRREAPLLD